jgi:hypothetical protein
VIAGFGPRGELPSPLPLPLPLSLPLPFSSPARDPSPATSHARPLRAAPLARGVAPPLLPSRGAAPPGPRPLGCGSLAPLRAAPRPRRVASGPVVAPARGPCPRAAWSPVRPLTPGSAAPRGSPSAFSRAWRSNLGLISF